MYDSVYLVLLLTLAQGVNFFPEALVACEDQAINGQLCVSCSHEWTMI